MRMLELLYWKYKTIDNILNDIKNQGFDTIKVGPILNVQKEKQFDWKKYNHPVELKVGNKLGSKNNLNNLVSKANKIGINIITEVDLNCEFFKEFDSIEKQQLYKDINEFKNLYLLKKISQFLYELSTCNINGISINTSKENIIFYRKIKELLKESNIKIYEKNSSYINIFLNYQNMEKIAFIENYYSFLFGKETRNIKSEKINSYYNLLTYSFENTLFYPRPIYFPYNDEGKRKNDFGICFNKINELDYYDNYFLTSNEIKEANFTKIKK